MIFHKNQKKIGEEVKRKKAPYIAAGCGLLLTAAAAAGYCFAAQSYRQAFFPRTVINGVDAAGKTIEEVKAEIASGTEGYRLTIYGRDGVKGELDHEAIGLRAEFDGTLEQILEGQNPYQWLSAYFHPVDYTISTMVVYEEEKLEEALDGLPFFQEEFMVQPQNAAISDYISGAGYEIIPEKKGSEVNRQAAKEEIAAAAVNLKTEINLDELGCYREPAVTADDEGLRERLALLNRYAGTEIRYQFGSQEEILNGDTIHLWIMEGEDGSLSLDRGMVSQYVSELAAKYNTAYKTRSFQTSYGKTVSVSGSYGWRINQEAETEELYQLLEAGTSQSREPVYSQKAASHDGNDYGNTYAEVNLTAQHMFFYKDGQKVLESDFVSGNVKKNYTTPPGIFGLTYKQKDAVLRGEGYASPVDFWMPFNGGIGFHDATWRSSFGGQIYKTNGSHGCINMPYQAAKELYGYVYTNVPVICYNLDGTESGKASSGKTEAAPQTTQAAAPTQPETPAPTQPESTAPTQPETPAPEPTQGETFPVIQPVQPETPAPTQPESTAPTPAATTAPEQTEAEIEPVTESETPPKEPDEWGPGTVSTTAAKETEIGPGV